jgi:hypothetical protein
MEQTELAPPSRGPDRRSNFPWKTSILCLTLIILAALAAFTLLRSVDKFRTGKITTTFISDIPIVTSTHGNVLELATAESTETLSTTDSQYVYNVYLGTTKAEIRVPVTYRYHLILSDPWRLAARGNICIVQAPMFHASQPPAIHTQEMEKSAESGWARFDKDAKLDELEKSLTPELEMRAMDPRHMDLVREKCRSSVADFVRNWLITRAQWPNRFDAIVVVFPDEHEFGSDKELQNFRGKPSLEIHP